jgi:hypothetical protein
VYAARVRRGYERDHEDCDAEDCDAVAQYKRFGGEEVIGKPDGEELGVDADADARDLLQAHCNNNCKFIHIGEIGNESISTVSIPRCARYQSQEERIDDTQDSTGLKAYTRAVSCTNAPMRP